MKPWQESWAPAVGFWKHSVLFFKKEINLFLVVLDLCCCTGFSLVVVSEACSLFSVLRLLIAVLRAQASHCCGFYCWGAWASTVQVSRLQSKGSTVVVHGLSCSEVSGIFLDQGSNLCLLHWQADSLLLSHKGSLKTFTNLKVIPTW